ncbi:MAG: MFS transporter [Gammaproteobacteria bacterium]|nr:MFS transporter [Gammaproteobacteria bacterium]
MPLRNILILISCQLISATGAFIMVALGGIIGAKLSVDPAFATLPISVMVLCMAATTVPATMLMQRLGRRRGFSLASLSAVIGILLAGLALYAESFKLFVLAGATLGINMAFTQQYRYAASESVRPEYSSRAISYVLLGAIGGALAGPEFVKYGEYAVPSVQYLGTLLAMAGMYALQSVLFLTLGPLHGDAVEAPRTEPRPLRVIVRQPIFIVALLGGAAAYGVMTFIMTATPLSMHIHDGFGLEETARVIQSHVLAMYVPSLVTGHLIQRFGLVRIMSIGALGLVAACMVGLQGQSYMHYWYTLVLLGVGWNFLYVGATTMVTLTYSLAERFRAQAVNEFFVFGTSALASLLAGTILHLLGWFALIVVPVPLLLITLTGLLLVRKDPLVARLQPSAV